MASVRDEDNAADAVSVMTIPNVAPDLAGPVWLVAGWLAGCALAWARPINGPRYLSSAQRFNEPGEADEGLLVGLEAPTNLASLGGTNIASICVNLAWLKFPPRTELMFVAG